MTTKNSLVTTRETADSTERQHPGQDGLAPQLASLVRERPKLSYRTVLRKIPPGGPERGRGMRSPLGQTKRYVPRLTT